MTVVDKLQYQSEEIKLTGRSQLVHTAIAHNTHTHTHTHTHTQEIVLTGDRGWVES